MKSPKSLSVPDTVRKSYFYYNSYRGKAKIMKSLYSGKIKFANKEIAKLKNTIKSLSVVYKKELGIDIEKSTEYVAEKETPKRSVYNICFDYLKTDKKLGRTAANIFIKYINIVNERNKNKELLDSLYKLYKMNYNEMAYYYKLYYYAICKILINGGAYELSNGMGYLCIRKYRNNDVLVLDLAATAANKRKLIAEGKTPYDLKTAEYCKKIGVPYDGVKYQVFVSPTQRYYLHYEPKLGYSNINFVRRDIKSGKYSDLTIDELSELADGDLDYLCNFDLDVITKLTIYLKKHPEASLNFIRYD